MDCWNTGTQLGVVAFDVIRQDFHRPIVNGKCNRENIEDAILDGIYLGHLPAMNKDDVTFVCNLIDELIDRGKHAR